MFTSHWSLHGQDTIHTDAPIRQVYLWILDQANNVVIVSKDGKSWQLPGGKPEPDESLKATALREVLEETGLDIHEHRDDMSVFGYYTVEELKDDSQKIQDRFVQVRLQLKLRHIPDSLNPREPEDSEAVKYARKVSFATLLNYMPWMREKEEYRYIRSITEA